MSKYDAPADEWPKKGNSAGGNQTGYLVEARLAYHTPMAVCGRVLDTRWSVIYFPEGVIGVPGPRIDNMLAVAGLLSYQQAQALRWWFHAEAARTMDHMCLETRLVECKLKYSYEYEQVGAHVVVGGGDRSGVMPNYGAAPSHGATVGA